MKPNIEIGAFLDRLPRLAIHQLPEGINVPRMRSVKPLIAYNGFDGYERMRTWEVAKWLMAEGVMPKPVHCDLCTTSAEQYHAENYFDLRTYVPVCRSCHAKLHNRLRNFATWQRRLSEYGLSESHWAN